MLLLTVALIRNERRARTMIPGTWSMVISTVTVCFDQLEEDVEEVGVGGDGEEERNVRAK